MTRDRIDFISEYCDRWCERCAFTTRCSAFAAQAAIAMCGDVADGLELAVGVPHPKGPGASPPEPPAWLADLANVQVTEADVAEFRRLEAARRARVEATPAMQIAWAFTTLSYRWLKAHYDAVRAAGDEVVREALQIALYDSTFITVKLSRALHGRDEHEHDEDPDDHPVQNDWNGSAKVALIAMRRSEAAWRVLGGVTHEETPGVLAEQLRDLAGEVEALFPDVWSFVRPGFDEPGR